MASLEAEGLYVGAQGSAHAEPVDGQADRVVGEDPLHAVEHSLAVEDLGDDPDRWTLEPGLRGWATCSTSATLVA